VKVIGLTGTIASGKSTVSRWFRSWGAEVVEADRIGHVLLRSGSPAHGKLIRAFGKDILQKDGQINRKLLGQKVFADPKSRRRLNRIVHPLLLRALRVIIERARSKGDRILVVVAALIPEWKIGGWFDSVIAVTSPREQRIQRLMDSGFTKKEARQRLGSQLPEREKCREADVIISNRGSLSALRKKADTVWNQLREDSCFRN
jgi:dephospho-CoA kinase